MKLWAALYTTIWVVLLEILLGLWPSPPPEVPYLHLALGLGIVAITYYCYTRLRMTRVPARVKRVAGASFSLSIVMVVLGLLLWFNVGATWVVPGLHLSIYNAILFVHVLNAIAIVTQMAAAAIAYDMWEDHEFERESEPGQIESPAPH